MPQLFFSVREVNVVFCSQAVELKKKCADKYGVSCYMVTCGTAHNLNPGPCVMTLIRYKHLHKEQKWPVSTKQWHTLAAHTLLFSCTNLWLRINSSFLLISIFDYEKKSSRLHLEPREPPSVSRKMINNLITIK